MLFLGIDPGLDGALAVVNERGEFMQVDDAPTTRKGKRDYLLQDMVLLLDTITHLDGVQAGIERVHAFPGQGVTSMFSMGHGFGIWKGILATCDIPFVLIEPAVWKRSSGLLGKDKEASRLLAQQRWPTAPLSLKKFHGRAEALLIADYTRRLKWQGQLKGVDHGRDQTE